MTFVSLESKNMDILKKERVVNMNIKGNKPKRPFIIYYGMMLAVILLLNLVIMPMITEGSVKETTYDEFLEEIKLGNVTTVEVQEQNYAIYYIVEEDGKEQICKTGMMEDPDFIRRLEDTKVGGILF